MNFIHDYGEQIHQLERHLAHSVADGYIGDALSLVIYLFKKEMILRTLYLRQTVTIKVQLAVDRALG